MDLDLSNRGISTWSEVHEHIDAAGFTLDASDTAKVLLNGLYLNNNQIATWEGFTSISARSLQCKDHEIGSLRVLHLHNNKIDTWEGFTPGSLKALFIRENPVDAFGISLRQLKAGYHIRMHLQRIRRDKLLRRWVACYRAGVMCTILETNRDSALFEDFRVGFLAG